MIILAHLSYVYKYACVILVAYCPSSVCPTGCLYLNFSHCDLLLQNHGANFTKLYTKHPRTEGIKVCLNEGSHPFPRGEKAQIKPTTLRVTTEQLEPIKSMERPSQ